MEPSRLLAASGTLILMTLVCGAVARDITRQDRPFAAEPPRATAITSMKTDPMPAPHGDEADDDDTTVP